MNLEFSYGQGGYEDRQYRARGEIVLGAHKLYLRGPKGDLVRTYVPLDKIEKMTRKGDTVKLFIRPSMSLRYVVSFKGEKTLMEDLSRDIARRRGLKKRFWRAEWFEEET